MTSASPIQDLSENTTVQNEETTRQVETTNTFEISTQEIPVTVIDNDQVDYSGSSSGSGDFFFKNDSSAIAGNLTLDYGPTENPILIMEEETTTDSPLIDTTLLVEITTTNDVTTTSPKPTSAKADFESSAEGSGFNFEGSTSINVDDEDLYKSNELKSTHVPPEVTTGSADIPICLNSNDCPKPKTCVDGKCVCKYGFTLESDCIEYSICPGLNDLPCSGKGTCIPPDNCSKWSADNVTSQPADCMGSCECFADYSGTGCSQWQSAEPPVPDKDMIGCMLDCGEFGSCEMYNETMFKCMCDEGHFGEHCELSSEENEGESSYIRGTPEPTEPTEPATSETKIFVNSTTLLFTTPSLNSTASPMISNQLSTEPTNRGTTIETNGPNSTNIVSTESPYASTSPSLTESPTILYIAQETSTPPAGESIINSSSDMQTTTPESFLQTTTLPWTKNKVENGSITQTIGIYLKDDSYHHVIDLNPEQEILIELRKIISDLYQMDDFLPKTFDVESIEFIESSLEPVISSGPKAGTDKSDETDFNNENAVRNRSKRQNKIPRVWKISMKVKYLEESDFARGLLSTDEIKIEYSRIYKMLERFARDGDYRILFGTPPNNPPDTKDITDSDNDTIDTVLSTLSPIESNTEKIIVTSTGEPNTTESIFTESYLNNDTVDVSVNVTTIIGEVIEEATTLTMVITDKSVNNEGSGSGFGENDSEDSQQSNPSRPNGSDGSGFYGEERLTDDPDLLPDHDASPTIHPDVSFRFFMNFYLVFNFLKSCFRSKILPNGTKILYPVESWIGEDESGSADYSDDSESSMIRGDFAYKKPTELTTKPVDLFEAPPRGDIPNMPKKMMKAMDKLMVAGTR